MNYIQVYRRRSTSSHYRKSVECYSHRQEPRTGLVLGVVSRILNFRKDLALRLGPLLFLVYINDMVLDKSLTSNSQIQLILFADDTTISVASDNITLTADILSKELHRIEE